MKILASSYDQSCKSDADCVLVGEGDACGGCQLACPSAAINVHAKGQYDADVAVTPASAQHGNCNCPEYFYFVSCCRQGVCRAGQACNSPGDAGGG
jgi:hypothetical protein